MLHVTAMNSDHEEVDKKPPKPAGQEATSTLQEKQINSSVDHFHMASRLQDSVQVSSDIQKVVMSSSEKLTDEQKAAMGRLKKEIIPLLERISAKMAKQAQLTAPVAGLSYVHRRNETKFRRDAKAMFEFETKGNNSMISPHMGRICLDNKLAESEELPTTILDTRNKRKTPRKKQKVEDKPSIESLLPKPKNGNFYSPQEVITIDQFLPSKVSRNQLVNHLVSNRLLPVKRTAVFTMLQTNDNGRPVNVEWHMRGRKPILDHDEFQGVKDELTALDSEVIADEEIKQKIILMKQKKIMERGTDPLAILEYEPAKSTIRNYRKMFLYMDKNTEKTDV